MLVVAASLFIVADMLVFAPRFEERKRLKLEIAGMEAKITAGSTLRNQLLEQLALDPNIREQRRLDRLQSEIVRLDKELMEKTVAFISPQQMVMVLKDMIERQQNLRLITLKATGAEPLLEAESEKNTANNSEIDEALLMTRSAASKAANVYRHGVEMQFKGDYFAVLAYLKKLESSDWQFEWKAIDIMLTKYPVTVVRLHISTLSMAEGWIGV